MESSEIGLLLVEVESTYGTDPTPTNAANFIPVLRDSVNFRILAEPVGRKFLTGGIAANKGFNTLPTCELTFRYELRGNLRNGGTELDISNGTDTQKIEIDMLLRASGLAATYTAAGTPGSEGSSAGSRDGYVTYSSSFASDAEGTSVTAYWISKTKVHKLTGGKVTFKVMAGAGKPASIEFTIRGKYTTPADNTLSTSGLDPLETLPPLWQGNTTTITKASGTHSPILTSFEFDLANEIVRRDSAAATYGVHGFLIADCNPRARLNPEAVTEATNPFWGDWLNSDVRTVTVPIGTAAGNTCTLTFSGEYKDVNYTAVNKFRHHDCQIDVVKPNLDSTDATWFSIKFG